MDEVDVQSPSGLANTHLVVRRRGQGHLNLTLRAHHGGLATATHGGGTDTCGVTGWKEDETLVNCDR